ncbi:hypothetical protein DRO66_09245 [Candidatus Bathyarchaeota archaeon]|nr:MAG: hypothetical protein DRO66_09245 [Candidatus Bathyarchaeota archaeon]
MKRVIRKCIACGQDTSSSLQHKGKVFCSGYCRGAYETEKAIVEMIKKRIKAISDYGEKNAHIDVFPAIYELERVINSIKNGDHLK